MTRRQDSRHTGHLQVQQQSSESHNEDARRSVTARCLQKVRQVLRSHFICKNNVQASDTLPVIRQPAGMVSLPQGKIDASGVKMQKVLTIHREFTQSPRFYNQQEQESEDELREHLNQQMTKGDEEEKRTFSKGSHHGSTHTGTRSSKTGPKMQAGECRPSIGEKSTQYNTPWKLPANKRAQMYVYTVYGSM